MLSSDIPAARARLLIVEDEALIAEEVQDRMRRLGYEVVGIADTEAQALALSHNERPDLVLMDIRLKGGSDGISAAEKIARLDIPVVYLTAHSDHATLSRITSQFGYVLKPFQERVLATAAEMALERHRTNKRLRETEVAYETVLRGIIGGVVVVSASGAVRFMNQAAEQLLGLPLEDARGRPAQEVVRIADDPAAPDPFRRALDGERWVFGLDCVLLGPQGRRIAIEGSVSPLLGPEGHKEGAVAILYDVREKRDAVAALRSSQALLAAGIEAIADGFMSIDLEERVLACNRSLVEMFHIPEEVLQLKNAEAIGRHVAPLTLDAEAHQRLRRERVRSPGATDLLHMIDGRIIERRSEPLMLAGKRIGTVGTYRDLTRQRKAEETRRESEKLAAMGALVGGVAHEVRNPLFALSSTLEAIEARAEFPAAFSESFSMLHEQIERMSQLMHGLLEFGEPAESRGEAVPVSELLSRAASRCLQLSRSTGVGVRLDAGGDLPAIAGDGERLVLALRNVIDNAIRFSPAKGHVEVSARLVSEGGRRWIECAVEDSGPGFGEEGARIFEPFFSRRSGGTGLGLALVRRIVHEHGGVVVAENRPGGGASVRVRLPTEPVTA
jgi:PAS domain S-box-containing protein